MIYIAVALTVEAKPLITYFKLKYFRYFINSYKIV